jgi:hypothetical protein
MKNDAGIRGQATIRLFGPDGNLKFHEVHHNLITTVGDEYYAKMGCAGVGGQAAPTLVSGMKLGKGTTAPTKTTGALSGVYVTGSNNAFSTVGTSAVGGNAGWKITYSTQWGAGDATDTLTEAILCTDQSQDAASTEAEVIARVVFTAINKGANDTLVINWDHTFYDQP